MKKHALSLSVALALAAAAPAFAHDTPALSSAPYPGTLKLSVDATDLAHRVFKVREEIPVAPGPLRVYYPQWLPGNHGPAGPIHEIAGLRFRGNGQVIGWKRDPLDMYSFLLEVPAGVSTVVAEFEHLSPVGNAPGRVVMTPEIVGLQWNSVTLYPSGYRADQIPVQASVTLPAGWGFGTALETVDGANKAGACAVQFTPTDVDTLIDSPLLAGKYHRQIDLTPAGAARPVRPSALRGLTGPALLGLAAVVGLALLVPLGSLGYWLLHGASAAVDWAAIGQTTANTLALAAGAALLTTAMALPTGWLAVRARGRVPTLLERSTYLGSSVPGIVVALALVTLSIRATPWLYQTVPVLLAAYAILFLPRAIVTVRAAVEQSPRLYDDVAASLGSTAPDRLRRVTPWSSSPSSPS